MEDLKNKLFEMRLALSDAEASGAEAEETVELDQTRQGRLSRMDAMRAQAMSRATGDKRRELLRDIEAALERMDRNEFGDCLECGEPIAQARLNARPTATLCIDCAESVETES